MKKVENIIVLNIVLAIYSVLGVFSKKAAAEEILSWKFILFYGIVLAGLAIYAIVWQQLLKKLPLITAYANKSITVIWGIIWGYIFFGELITLKKLVGALVIVLGVYIVIKSDYDIEDEENLFNG